MIWLVVALASPLVNPDASVQLADADGDGHIDVVMNAGEAIHYGDGLGGVGPLTPQTAGVDADAALVVDLDGDGLPELCRAHWDRIDCHQGIGRGMGPVLLTVPERTFAMLPVDADNDGDMDLIISTLGGVTVHANDGAGGLTPGALSPGITPDVFLEADIDGDGDLDVAAAKTNVNDAWWFERDDATGTLLSAEVLLYPVTASSLAFVDATGDGLPDFLTQSYTHPIYLRAKGEEATVLIDTADSGSGVPTGFDYGPLQPIGDHTGPFVVAALDASAPAGLIVCDRDEVRWDAGIDGAFVSLWAAEEPDDRVCRTPAADFDEDGALDVLTATLDLSVTLDPLGAATTTTLQRALPFMGPSATGDLDGDGVTDLVYAGETEADVLWLRGAGGGAMEAVQALLTAPAPLMDLALLDLTGDGLVDVGMVDRGGNVGLAAGTGGGSLAETLIIGGGATGEGVAIDADQDGILEWAVPTSAGITVFDGDGSGGTVGAIVATGRTKALATGDTDGDGLADLVALTPTELVVLRSGPGGLVEAMRAPASGRNPFDLVLLDGDGDGRDHVVVMGACEQEPDPYYGGLRCVTEERLYELEESGGALIAIGLVAEAAGPMAVVDWADDGLEELVTTQGSQLVRLDQTFTATAFGARWPTVDLLPADLDDDGDVDLIQVQQSGMWALWNLGIGDGSTPGDTGDSGLPDDTGSTDDTGQVPPTDTGPTDTGTGPTPPAEPTDDQDDDDDGGCGCQAVEVSPWPVFLARRR